MNKKNKKFILAIVLVLGIANIICFAPVVRAVYYHAYSADGKQSFNIYLSVNNDASLTTSSMVAVLAGSVANSALGTVTFSNFPDLSKSVTVTLNGDKSKSIAIAWDLCRGFSKCESGAHTVYAQFYGVSCGNVGPISVDIALELPKGISEEPKTLPTSTEPTLSSTTTTSTVSIPNNETHDAALTSAELQGSTAVVLNSDAASKLSPQASSFVSSAERAIQAVFPGVSQSVFHSIETIAHGAQESFPPIGAASTAVVAISSIVGALSLSASGVQLTGYLRYIAQSFFLFAGLKKRTVQWGTVYNAKTKEPLPFVKIQLINKEERVLETRTTDRFGRYGFLPEGNVASELRIAISDTRFQFPSKIVSSGADVFYENIYHGEFFHPKKEIVHFNIPLDPSLLHVSSHIVPNRAINNVIARTANATFWVGLVTMPIGYLLHPTTSSLGFLVAMIGVDLVRFVGDLRAHPTGLVRDIHTHAPLPYALVALYDKFGARKSFAVTNASGQYFLLSEKGTFTLKFSTPANIESMRTREKTIVTAQGWIVEEGSV